MSETMLMQAKGVNGALELWPDHIHIRREGWTAGLYNRDNRGILSLRDIYHIQFHEVPSGLVGYISFNFGTDENGIEDYTVSFLKHQEHAFQAIHKMILHHRQLAQSQHPTPEALPQERQHHARI